MSARDASRSRRKCRCVFVSRLDRTPRAYMFVLAGYSAILIALPSVEAPATIFTVASLRVQEITLGILGAQLRSC